MTFAYPAVLTLLALPVLLMVWEWRRRGAVVALQAGVERGEARMVLKGATGTGKTFVMSELIRRLNRPTLVLAPNKVLAAQLCSEFKALFPRNAVECVT